MGQEPCLDRGLRLACRGVAGHVWGSILSSWQTQGHIKGPSMQKAKEGASQHPLAVVALGKGPGKHRLRVVGAVVQPEVPANRPTSPTPAPLLGTQGLLMGASGV